MIGRGDGGPQRSRGNRNRRCSVVFTGLALCLSAAPGAADSLFGTISQGVSKAGQAVKGAADKAVDTVDSTVHIATNEGTPEEVRAEIDAIAEAALARLTQETPGAAELFEQSAGFAVFDTRRLTLLGVTGGFGRGVAVSRSDGTRDYMRMGTGGVGFSFGIGGLVSQMVILFEDDWTYRQFVTNGFDATATAGAMLGDEKPDLALQFVDGRSIFVLTDTGWKVSATAAGTKYWRDTNLN